MENKVVYEVRLSKPVLRVTMVLAVGLFSNAAVFSFDFTKPAQADTGVIISLLDRLISNQNKIRMEVQDTYFSTTMLRDDLEELETELSHRMKIYCKK